MESGEPPDTGCAGTSGLQAAKEFERLNHLLCPFTDGKLPADLIERLQLYLELLLKWNTRVNLTAVRASDEIITRHFGESLFAAKVLLGDPIRPSCGPTVEKQPATVTHAITLADVGSGAGFPGVPIKLWAPHLELTLIESQNKKATFLRELLRTLKLEPSQVFCGRAEQWGGTANIVTLRAVEQFERVLPVAAGLVAATGRLCLLIGAKQAGQAQRILGQSWQWTASLPIPLSQDRVVAIAERR